MTEEIGKIADVEITAIPEQAGVSHYKLFFWEGIMKLVSVVVVTYNQSAFVLETLDSIYDQTYPALELIVSDDCSRDNTLEAVEKWIETHRDRFESVQILTSEANMGVTRNCNRGIHSATGEYFQLIAGDDLLMPDAIEEKVAFSQHTGAKWFVSRVEVFGKESPKKQEMIAFCERGYEIISRGYEAQMENILYGNYIAGPSGGFMRTADFKELGGYDERYPMMEDYPFIYHYLKAGNEIILLDKVLARYRISEGSLISSKASPMWFSWRKFFFNELLGELLRRKKYKKALRRLLRLMKQSMRSSIWNLLGQKGNC